MKYIVLSLSLLLSVGLAAQLTSGKISFEEKYDMHAKLPAEAQQFKDMIPQFTTNTKELWFTAEVSKYQKTDTQEEPTVVERGGGVRMEFKNGSDENEIVHQIAKNQKMERKEFMGRTFLIEDEGLENMTWKIGQGQKEILGYVCQEAVHYGKRDTVFAWFTPQIPVATGPLGFGKLPGMILELETKSGVLQVTATDIDDTTPDAGLMKISGKGKKVSREEFDAIVEEKTQEMKEQNGGGMVIKIRN